MKKRKRLSGRTRRNWLYAYFFLAPWIIGVLLLVAYPLVSSVNFSFNSIRITPRGMVFTNVGFENYHNLFVLDTNFLQSLINFAAETVLQTPVIVSFALIIAILLNGRIRMRGIFRSVFFLPVIIATGPVMNELINQGVATVPMVDTQGLTAAIAFLPEWITEPIIGLFTELIMILWNAGVQILIFLAALQKVSPEMYEAAKIDGGSGWECFWKITLPAIMPMIFLNAIYTVVWLSQSGLNPIITLIYDSMYASSRGYGYASAEAWTYSIVILILLGICWLLLHERKDKPVKEVKRLQRRNW